MIDVGDALLTQGFTIRGHVTDDHGDPVADADVVVRTESGCYAEPWRRLVHGEVHATSDAGGAYVIAGVTSIEHTNHFATIEATTGDDRVAMPAFLRAGSQTVDLQLPPPGWLIGHTLGPAPPSMCPRP